MWFSVHSNLYKDSSMPNVRKSKQNEREERNPTFIQKCSFHNSADLRTKLEFHYTMDCGLHCLVLELALQCKS